MNLLLLYVNLWGFFFRFVQEQNSDFGYFLQLLYELRCFSMVISCAFFLISLSRPSDEENTSFRALEVLLLDDNKLSSEVFNSLKNLKRSLCYYCFQKYKTENLCNSIK